MRIWFKQTKLEMKGSEKGSESSFSHERRQASVWGNVGGRNEEAFRYSLISVPLSLAFPDSTVRQNPKHHFLTSNWYDQSLSTNTPKWSPLDNWYYVSHERCQSYKEWYMTIIKFILPSSSLKPLSIEYVNDLYWGISAKNCSREKRAQSEKWVRLGSLEQKLLPNKEWLAFFHNIKN